MPRIRSLRRALVLCLALLVCPGAFAQISANLRGRVLDGAGAAVAGARISLTATATGVQQRGVSSGTGDYLFANLNPGAYSVDVAATGFEHLQRDGITVIVGQTVSVDLALTAGGDQQTITVNGDAPLLQAATSNIETNIPGATVAGDAAELAQFYPALDAGARRGAAARDGAAAHQRRPPAHQRVSVRRHLRAAA